MLNCLKRANGPAELVSVRDVTRGVLKRGARGAGRFGCNGYLPCASKRLAGFETEIVASDHSHCTDGGSKCRVDSLDLDSVARCQNRAFPIKRKEEFAVGGIWNHCVPHAICQADDIRQVTKLQQRRDNGSSSDRGAGRIFGSALYKDRGFEQVPGTCHVEEAAGPKRAQELRIDCVAELAGSVKASLPGHDCPDCGFKLLLIRTE